MANAGSKGNSTNTNGGTEISFQNTPQAKDDAFGTAQSGQLNYVSTVYVLNVMGNDLGGNAKSLWSVDDGINQSGAMSGHEAGDLLTQDGAGITGIAGNRSLFGASLSVTADGKVAYDTSTIDANYADTLTQLALGQTLSDSFIYAIRLASGTLSWAKATVTLTGVNDTPVVQNVSLLAVEDGGSVSGAFNGDDIDSDDDGSTLSYSILGAPGVGTLTNNGNGTFTYDPGANFQSLALGQTETLTVTYVATDRHGAISAPATLTITVTGTNDGPTLAAGSLSAVEDGQAVTLDLTALGDDIDSDDDGSSLTYTLLSSPSAGSASITDRVLTFAPGSDFQALSEGQTTQVSVDVEAKDRHGLTAVNTVTITVTGVNDRPTVTNVAVQAQEDGAAVTGAFVGDDVDNDDTPSSLAYSFLSAPNAGTLTNNGDGTFTFAPGSDFQSLAQGQTTQLSIDYTATDSHQSVSDAGTASITVTGVNDAPTLAAGALSAVEDGQAVTLDLTGLGNDVDSDDDGSTLTYTLLSAPSAGTASIANRTLSFAPGTDFQSLAAGETTTVSVDVQAKDQHGAAVVNTVTITVTGVNDRPTVTNVAVQAQEDGGPVTVAFSGNDIDSDDTGASLTYTLLGGAPVGTVTNNGNGTFTYNVGNNFQGLAQGQSTQISVDYTATDSHNALSTPATAVITVTGVNDGPTLAAGAMSATEDGPAVSLNLAALGNDVDSDDDGSTLSYALIGTPSGGSASISGTTLTFAPGADFQSLAAGQTRDVFLTVSAKDSHNATATNQVKVTVTGVNDAPVVSGDAAGAVTLTPAAAPFNVQQFTNYQGAFDLASLRNYASTHTANYTATTNVIDYTDDPSGFSGEIPGSSRWPAAVALGVSGTGGINDRFFAKITSTVTITQADTYTFRTYNDDGVYVSVNNQLIISDSTQHPELPFTGSIYLTPGTYPVELYFFENGGEASLEFTYKNSGGVYQHVNPANVTDSGVLQFSDVDLNDVHSVSVAPVGSNQGTLTAIKNVDTTGSGTGGQVTWNYQIPNSAYASLPVGQTVTESFTVSVNDGKGGIAQQQVNVVVTGGYKGPEANADLASVNEDQSVTISVLTNDSGNGLSLLSAAGAQNGTVSVSGNNVIYTPAPNYNGSDSFTYTIKDSFGTTSTASVGVTVAPVNDGPSINFARTSLVNGSFENSLNGWTYEEINYIGDWQAADGSKVLDMNAEHGRGYVEQTLQTIAGNQYTVSFALSKNPGSPTGIETLRVTAAGNSADYAFNLGNSSSNMLWQNKTFTFTATGASTVLRLASADPAGGADAWGPALDNVRLLGDVTAMEDVATQIRGLSISDIDAGSNPITVTLSVANGSLSINTAALGGADLNGADGTLSLTGTLANINAALAGSLVYQGKKDFFGADTLAVTVNDLGSTGSGSALSASTSLAINVAPTPDVYTVTNLVKNGSFEGNTSNWSVTQINHLTGWQAADGIWSLDMNAENGRGVITQTLTTAPGQTVTVGFALSKNPGSSSETLAVNTPVGGTSTYTFSTVNGNTDMKWTQKTYSFTPNSTSTILTFQSSDPAGNGDPYGPALDEVWAVAHRSITGFDKALGDKIDLNGLLTSLNAPHDGTAFSGQFVRFQSVGSDTVISVDANGGGDAYIAVVTLVGVTLLQTDAGNYIL